MTDPDPATREFAEHRELLFALVYNLLGTVADTEDVLQETWLSWMPRRRPGAPEITNPRAYLVRVAINAALSRQADIARRRETYVGPWLPEPLITDEDGDDPAVRTEAVSLAMLVVLETLTPLERAVFVLNEVFGYPHTEIAAMIGREPAAVRQLAHRARSHVQARRPRFRADPAVQRRVTEQFLEAQLGSDLDALLRLLAPDVTFLSDGGGRTQSALRPIHGAAKVARLLTGGPFYAKTAGALDIYPDYVNGELSLVALLNGKPYGVGVLEIDPETEQIRHIYAVSNPEKLTRVNPRADRAVANAPERR
ncbi:RNA polymerase sigma factor SigJ [Nocardia puris]|uniref:RNA polymerase sigma-70 factor (ECF subfamily) n=1 Tax=Nocardia puris TaxID=208602 RepID=A0A366D619_9NOCA|nr:RNA polymerase sigma factor SigJ [Nocardia puris]RBO85493.1 RNA polymerase sigma-70 factor (ECF subfamily) [Nocardia puris]